MILLGATAFTIWARLVLGVMWSEIKIHIEERFMLGEFPDEYPRYRERVPKLVPGLRLISGRRVASS